MEDRSWLLNYLEENQSSDLQELMQQLFNQDLDAGIEERDEKAIKLLEEIHRKIGGLQTPLVNEHPSGNEVKESRIIQQDFRAQDSPKKYQGRFREIKFRLGRAAAAAAILLFVAGIGSVYLFLGRKSPPEKTVMQEMPVGTDILPGGNKAVLKLADGKEIILDHAANGLLAFQSGADVLKLDDGLLAYNPVLEKSGELLYNTISTPRGGQYQLSLADGSRVWLNSSSSIHFPVTFSEEERRVQLTGEAYLEVANNPSVPFIVQINDTEIRVLGTRFNVNGYGDELMLKTTLIEGKLDVSRPADSKSLVIISGQQVQMNKNGEMTVNNEADLKEAIAWKSGYFHFNDTGIEEVMLQISRWYDIDVVFGKKNSDQRLTGIISRDVNASSIFKMLEISGVEIIVEDEKIIIK